MPPTTPRDFLKVAAQRLTTAGTLLREKLTLDAQYLGGYTVECSLKALILHRTPDPDKPEKLKQLTSGARCTGLIFCSGNCESRGWPSHLRSPSGCGASIGQPT